MAVTPALNGVSETTKTLTPEIALNELRDTEPCGAVLPASCMELVRSARMAGASWDQIGDVMGVTAAQARSRFVQSGPALPAPPPRPSADLDDEELMALVVAGAKAVRCLRATQ